MSNYYLVLVFKKNIMVTNKRTNYILKIIKKEIV